MAVNCSWGGGRFYVQRYYLHVVYVVREPLQRQQTGYHGIVCASTKRDDDRIQYGLKIFGTETGLPGRTGNRWRIREYI